jgi:hypothetical protein
LVVFFASTASRSLRRLTDYVDDLRNHPKIQFPVTEPLQKIFNCC